MLHDTIPLLRQYAAFLEGGGGDLRAFGLFLAQADTRTDGQVHLGQVEEDVAAFMDRDTEHFDRTAIRLSVLWSQLERYRQYLLRRALRDQELSSVDEYSLLAYVSLEEEATIKGFIAFTMLESTTAVEISKRLVQRGLLSSQPLPSDRRIRQLQLTPHGRAVLDATKPVMAQLGQLFYHGLAPDDLSTLHAAFTQLFNQREHHRQHPDLQDFQQFYQSITH